jgi:uncharacterized protein (TIGR00290 family)
VRQATVNKHPTDYKKIKTERGKRLDRPRGNECWVAWSTGKDSAFALYQWLKQPHCHVGALFSVINQSVDRVSLHSTRKQLLVIQAGQIGLPFYCVDIPENCSQKAYGEVMRAHIAFSEKAGIKNILFGDIHLAWVKSYREKQFQNSSIKPIFPLWGKSPKQLSQDMINCGIKAVIIAVDTHKLSVDHLGKCYDQAFLKSLPDYVDPCGENGEFHTFVFDAPFFKKGIPFKLGKIIHRDHMSFIDVIPVKAEIF